MPQDVIITIAAITVPFLLFAAVLAWVDYYTNSVRKT
jgi:hypothetical protein